LNNNIADQEKLLQYLFLNLAYLLRESREVIKYENPQYGDPALGFAITVFRINNKFYDYADQCFRLMGKITVRECGITMSVSFDTSKENDSFRENFKLRMRQAEERLPALNGKTPQEFYLLHFNPVIKNVTSTNSKHYVALQADIHDAVELHCLREALDPWADYKRIKDYHEITVDDNCNADIQMVFYRIRTRKKFLRYLKELNVEGAI